MSVTEAAKLFPALSVGEDGKGMNGQTPFPPFPLCTTGRQGPTRASVKSGKAENAKFFHDFPIENPLSHQNMNLRVKMDS